VALLLPHAVVLSLIMSDSTLYGLIPRSLRVPGAAGLPGAAAPTANAPPPAESAPHARAARCGAPPRRRRGVGAARPGGTPGGGAGAGSRLARRAGATPRAARALAHARAPASAARRLGPLPPLPAPRRAAAHADFPRECSGAWLLTWHPSQGWRGRRVAARVRTLAAFERMEKAAAQLQRAVRARGARAVFRSRAAVRRALHASARTLQGAARRAAARPRLAALLAGEHTGPPQLPMRRAAVPARGAAPDSPWARAHRQGTRTRA